MRNTFTKRGGSVYTCDTCGRSTRHTGAQSLGSTLCPQCFDLAGIENEISDGHATIEEKREEIAALIAEIREKGGDPEESFGALLAPVTVENGQVVGSALRGAVATCDKCGRLFEAKHVYCVCRG